tara:strand:- start:1964 stop:2287 length:324 start_codon:yes stop_codon:yes gene_type:complete
MIKQIDRIVVQTINKKSFESHLAIIDDIRKCGEQNGVRLKLIKTIRAENKFIWEATYQEKKSYTDMTIAVMKLLFEKNIEPGNLVKEKQIMGCYQKLNALEEILKSA